MRSKRKQKKSAVANEAIGHKMRQLDHGGHMIPLAGAKIESKTLLPAQVRRRKQKAVLAAAILDSKLGMSGTAPATIPTAPSFSGQPNNIGLGPGGNPVYGGMYGLTNLAPQQQQPQQQQQQPQQRRGGGRGRRQSF